MHRRSTGALQRLHKHIIQRNARSDQVFNMDETSFFQNSWPTKAIVDKGLRNVWSRSSYCNFHLTIVACKSAACFVSLPLNIYQVIVSLRTCWTSATSRIEQGKSNIHRTLRSLRTIRLENLTASNFDSRFVSGSNIRFNSL